jgi:hydrogenase maturation protease
MRVLVAGVGNELRGDDGFGIEALHLLRRGGPFGADVRYYESGIAGIGLVQQLLDGFDALIILDALDRGAAPGTVFVLEPDPVLQGGTRGPSESIDLHQADPEGVLRLAAALRVLPPRVWIVGCQAAECDELGAGLTESVRRAVPTAVRRVYDILSSLGASVNHGPA